MSVSTLSTLVHPDLDMSIHLGGSIAPQGGQTTGGQISTRRLTA